MSIPTLLRAVTLSCLVAVPSALSQDAPGTHPRARDLGIPFDGTPGPWNAITDVPGVHVGHTTLISGSGPLTVGKGPVRTGVTAILPRGRRFGPVFAAAGRLNGNGELTGTDWIDESGQLEEPILFTNTHNVGSVYDAAIAWRGARGFHDDPGGFAWASLPVVGETWDGRLNDTHGRHVQRGHVFSALDGARTGPVAEGNVGGGTGMVCFRFKGGIGTASRVTADGFRLGVLVQANFGLREELVVAGIPVGRRLTDLMPEIHSIQPGFEGGSILVALATDAPLLPHQLRRLVHRIPLGIAKTGGIGRHSSGDLFLAFSTANHPAVEEVREVRMLPNDQIDPLLLATVQAVEEAILNALVAAETMDGINGNVVHAMPVGRMRQILIEHRRLAGMEPDVTRP